MKMEPQRVHPISENDLESAPMPRAHKQRVASHIRRLWKTIQTPNPTRIPGYTNKSAARKQLARMSVVFRDYISRHEQSKPEVGGLILEYYLSKFERRRLEDVARAIQFQLIFSKEIESMVADIVDASFYISDHTSLLPAVACTSSMFFGREQDIERSMQAIVVESTEDVVELHAIKECSRNEEKGEDIGKDIDWNKVLRRYRSEDNVAHYFKRNLQLEVREKWDYDLKEWEKWQLDDVTWPGPDDPDVEVRVTPMITSSMRSADVVHPATPSTLA